MADAWGGAWGTPSAWGVSWGAGGSSPPPTPTPTPPATNQFVTGGGDTFRIHDAATTQRVDFESRNEIAAELRAEYENLFPKAEKNAEAAEEVAEAVGQYAKLNAPLLPPPNLIDWVLISQQSIAVLIALRAALDAVALRLAEQDDEEAILLLLTN